MNNVIFQLKEEIFNIEKTISRCENRIVDYWHKEKVVNFYRKCIINQEKLLVEYKKAINILKDES